MSQDEDEEWQAQSGSELAHILALPEHVAALQLALDNARVEASSDWHGTARALLLRLGGDPEFKIVDATTNTQTALSRVDVLAEELMRAHFEA